jgi:hypothetical protein
MKKSHGQSDGGAVPTTPVEGEEPRSTMTSKTITAALHERVPNIERADGPIVDFVIVRFVLSRVRR